MGSSSSHTFMCQHILMQWIFSPSLLIPNWAAKVCEPPANVAVYECSLKAKESFGVYDVLMCGRAGVVSTYTQRTEDRT